MELLPLIPPFVALVLILWTRQAALSLAVAVITGVLLIHSGNPISASRALFEEHLFPVISGAWNLSALLFTLTLGAFATVLEKSGGFTVLLHRLLNKNSTNPQKKLLFGIYGLGLLCFFDGLANAVLLGRISRPITDSLKISRQFLAYLIDSTSACVACVAFISTWIATQLSLIQEGLKGSQIEAEATSLFFASIPANPYCLLTLALIPFVIAKSWHPGPMGKATPISSTEIITTNSNQKARSALIPLAVLVITLPGIIYLWQDGQQRSWKNAFVSEAVPYAMTAAGIIALIAACLYFPKERRSELPQHTLDGAAILIPALIILICAWSLGSVMKTLGTAQLLSDALNGNISLAYLPLIVFLLGSIISFLTGTSWGTMGLLMPLVLQTALGFEASPVEITAALPLLIGAVFGGAVFGDHCSPFSDTTIVSALAAGCSPTSHVITQLPYALVTAGGASIAYLLMALAVPAGIATLIMIAILTAFVLTRKN